MTEETIVTHPRTRDQVNNDYTQHAAHAGHKMRLVNELQKEIPAHFKAMSDLVAELAALPVEAKPPQETL